MSFPFERYLDVPEHNDQPVQHPHFPFDIPHFLNNGPPVLAQGGGAEVIPANAYFAMQNGYQPLNSHSLVQDTLKKPAPPVTNPLELKTLPFPPYSSTGFDVLNILAHVATRPNPKFDLGPVDLHSVAFVIVDIRRQDSPIVYASPSFFRLTGYEEHEVLGRNCRFLQSPPDNGVPPVEQPDITAYLRKHLTNQEEVRTLVTNYKKSGEPFENLVSIIPVGGVYHVGFQVDINAQVGGVIERMGNGSWVGDQRLGLPEKTVPLKLPLTIPSAKLLPRAGHPPSFPMGAHLKGLLSRLGQPPTPAISSSALPPLLLPSLPRTPIVVSLKGQFLYVAPSISTLLGYDDGELVGKAIKDICVEGDLVGVLRELKEGGGATNGLGPSTDSEDGSHADSSDGSGPKPRLVDILFRALVKPPNQQSSSSCLPTSPASQTSSSPAPSAAQIGPDMWPQSYVWLMARGRLHVEPGKGRKAIILSARVADREPDLPVHDVIGTLGRSTTDNNSKSCHGTIHAPTGTILTASSSAADLLGCEADNLVGQKIWGPAPDTFTPQSKWKRHSPPMNSLPLPPQEYTSKYDPTGSGVNFGDHGLMEARGWLRNVVRKADQWKEEFKQVLDDLQAEELAKDAQDGFVQHEFVLQSGTSSTFSGTSFKLSQPNRNMGMAQTLMPLVLLQQQSGVPVPVWVTLFHDASGKASLSGIVQAPMIFTIHPMAHEEFQVLCDGHLPAATTMPTAFQRRGARPEPKDEAPVEQKDLGTLFAEFVAARNSSWQYELQQILLLNKQLEEEIKGLQSQLETTSKAGTMVASSPSGNLATGSESIAGSSPHNESASASFSVEEPAVFSFTGPPSLSVRVRNLQAGQDMPSETPVYPFYSPVSINYDQDHPLARNFGFETGQLRPETHDMFTLNSSPGSLTSNSSLSSPTGSLRVLPSPVLRPVNPVAPRPASLSMSMLSPGPPPPRQRSYTQPGWGVPLLPPSPSNSGFAGSTPMSSSLMSLSSSSEISGALGIPMPSAISNPVFQGLNEGYPLQASDGGVDGHFEPDRRVANEAEWRMSGHGPSSIKRSWGFADSGG